MNVLKSRVCFVVLLASFAFGALARAEMVPPETVVKNTVDSMVTNIQSNRALYESDTTALYKMVEDTLIPAIHVPRMSKLILGRYVKSATAEQIEAFSSEFQTFLMRSYATALLEYTGDEKVNYLPSKVSESGDKVVINAQLTSADGETYPISLYMSNRRDTSWRAYNMEVAGINFISTYRATFKTTLESRGVQGLIDDLKAKNEA